MHVRRLSAAIAIPAIAALAAVPTASGASATQTYRADAMPAVKYAVPAVKYADVPTVKYTQPMPAAQAARRLSVTVAARPSAVKPMQRMHLTGIVGPGAAGATVTVQVKTRGWQTIPGARTKADRLGRYAIDVWGKRRGSFTLRVVGALGSNWGTSKLIMLKVR